MSVLPTSSTCLELAMSIPGFVSSQSLPSSGDHTGNGNSMRMMMKDLDINQVPRDSGGGGGGGEEEWTTTVASMEDEEEETNNDGASGPPRKKLRLTTEQSRILEETFRFNHSLNPKQKEDLAMQLKLKARQVEVWFQNRRARSKLKQTEIECEYLKRWFGSLREQNRRLQKEVEELRAIKVGRCDEPLHSASTLTMCPSCEQVAAATSTTMHDIDKGPIRTTASATNQTSLSSKVHTIHNHSRHPSAAFPHKIH
ncbi:homeobox-leucine zipper protein ATHB-X-like [Camellia sinensis]|uniref:homeobox-leucine zipper protein ATHB-X-like n=1 Tax=Camellia sinensis TaxID=4442 RepID=UPI001035F273|nr:homeobox-leucine zipper protein ATHB-X-like [Camellia sinensis]